MSVPQLERSWIKFHYEDLGSGWEENVRMYVTETGFERWIRSSWLETGPNAELSWTQHWTLGTIILSGTILSLVVSVLEEKLDINLWAGYLNPMDQPARERLLRVFKWRIGMSLTSPCATCRTSPSCGSFTPQCGSSRHLSKIWKKWKRMVTYFKDTSVLID